ncbi:MAG: CaiB/BaiF CoA-transferase family protein [Acidimicrobiales bacterium]
MEQGAGRALGGIRVVELSCGIAGGYCTKLFADAGADVIKVEPPGGDPLRAWSASEVDLRGADGALFEFVAASKRSVVGAPGDSDIDELVSTADMVVVDRDTDIGARGRRKGSVLVSITPFGRTGEWADRPATEFTVQAESGSIGARGRKNEEPVQAGGWIAEWVAGAYGAAAGIAAVRHARRTGQGAEIDVSMAEVMCICTGLFSDLMMSLLGRPPLPQPPRVVEFPSIAPTSDGWVGFNTNAAQMFEDFLVLIGQPEFEGRALGRMDPTVQPVLEAAMNAWTSAHTTNEVIDEASLFRIPVAPVGNGENLVDHEHLKARGVFGPSPSGAFVQPKPPYLIDGRRLGPSAPAPSLGEHTGQIESTSRPEPPEPGAIDELPMAGLKVLDLTCWWAGPAATSLFAALGADVLHVESAQRIDGMRPAAAGYFVGRERWWEWSAFFLQINVNKRGITLNLADPRGLELAKRLVQWADLVVENYTPRVMEAFGLDWPAVHAINPKAVMVRMPAYGLDGPWRDRVGFAQTMEAMSGLAWVTGHEGGPPMLPRGPCDPNGAMHAAFAMQVALHACEQTGAGVLVEAPLIESALNIAADQVIEHSAYGVLLGRHGNRSAGCAPQGIYPCRGEEHWLALSVASDEQWAGLRKGLGDPGWASDPDLGTYAGRRAAADRIDAALTQWAADHDVADAVEQLIAVGVPAGEVTDFRSISTHPHLLARGFFETVDHPVVGSHLIPVQPFRYSGIERWVRSPAPVLGQDNQEVLGAIVGLPAMEIEELAAAGVIGDRLIE